ncbi:hypothetical protein CS535_17400 [Yersinia massiliensis]|uniref:Uncharacterized protein n=1 Tax=Yersinia hibernica TaxID=2339259 RepID=A0ABX5R419_9GAMM|nr:hypothetical protein CS535_17400 [Yersinia massiliensis]QAX80258.1 hypothetical protein D5F51_17975 [Yersinia hibernica]
MLSWKLMMATERACRNVCEGEEAAAHDNDILSICDRMALWSEGFIAGWREENACITLSERFRQKVNRWRR